MTLDELLDALNDGEPRAEERLFQRLRVELLPFFKKRVQASDAEDLTQETLAIVAKRLRTTPFERGPVSFRSFAFGVAWFRVRDNRRAKVRDQLPLPPFPEWCDVPESSLDEAAMTLQQSALLHAALVAIKTCYRRALESRLRDEDPREFAEAEGIEVGTVRSRVHRALELVRAEIEARRRTPRTASPTG
ncbi:RNA polymerase sigma factor [Enhygromyxa salina]|uniref:RNA polymerase sigma factor n=1 Tax=Enhygromyxa salina TaxID=215803 RepID=A0A2S9YQU7_9BACT|nr:RNA polymerase sigma factor [Enhygromyxa salina]PRQ07474.1 RNA polymerase sigma factor [Enhygromyxa salina]